MKTLATRLRNNAALLAAFLPIALFLLALCAACGAGPRSSVDLAPFKQIARDANCADVRNRLFLIDDRMVFSDRAGNCADASYSQTLYGSSPDEVLCSANDSIAGPRKECPDAQYQAMFETMTANLDKPDLGLGSEHTVRQVR